MRQLDVMLFQLATSPAAPPIVRLPPVWYGPRLLPLVFVRRGGEVV